MEQIILQYPDNFFESLDNSGISSSRVRHKMVERLQQKGLDHPLVIQALKMVPRHYFVDEGFFALAYDEHKALPIGYRQTISQPLVVARMTQWLLQGQSLPLNRVLEIGTGSGYQTAILALLSKQVYSLERIKPLAAHTQSKLHSMGLNNICFGNGDGHWGWKEHAPYDAIISAASPESLPGELIEQLCIGGRLVMPIGTGSQQLCGFIRRENHIEEYPLGSASFVPMLKGIETHQTLK